MTTSLNPPTQRQMARILNCSQSNINRIINKKLGKKRMKPQVHKLYPMNIEQRYKRSMALYMKLNNGKWQNYVTTDKAWFHMANCNGKRKIQYVSRDLKNPKLDCFERRENHSKGLMVWVSHLRVKLNYISSNLG